MPTSPFHSEGAMIPDEQQPNKSSVGQFPLPPAGVRVAQKDDVTGPLWAKCLAGVEKPKSFEKTETGMLGRKGKHTEKGPRGPATEFALRCPFARN